MIIFSIILFFIIWAIGVVGSWMIAEKYHPKAFGIFDFYPFICRKCLCFWGMLILYIVGAILLNSIGFGLLGALFAAMNGLAIHYTEMERMNDEADLINDKIMMK